MFHTEEFVQMAYAPTFRSDGMRPYRVHTRWHRGLFEYVSWLRSELATAEALLDRVIIRPVSVAAGNGPAGK